jgi:hypothetical protein
MERCLCKHIFKKKWLDIRHVLEEGKEKNVRLRGEES